MEWNVENLFDTIHCEGRQDAEFTPTGSYQWTSHRYWAKLSRLSRTIAAVGGDTPCDLVALIEVENDSVMHHLAHRTKLWRMGYEYVMTSTNDVRGISIGLLYQPHKFRPVSIDTLHFSPFLRSQSLTRDALHVAGETITGDTLDVLVVHWPSRRNGRPAKLFRENIGQQVRNFCDSLLSIRQHAALVLTGDFNAWYGEKCITQCLGAMRPSESPLPRQLYILSDSLFAPRGIAGTYKYQGEWNRLDQFIVSGTLLTKPHSYDSFHTSASLCRIADLTFLLQDEKASEGVRPYRTYLGTHYQGGYSDHLPLVLDLLF